MTDSKNITYFIGLFFAAMMVTGCGKDSFSVPDSTTTLTQAQAEALAEFLGIDGINDVFFDSVIASGGDSGSFGFDDGEVLCDSGEIPTEGSGSANVDFEAETVRANLTANNQEIVNCSIDGSQGSDIEITTADLQWKGNYRENATSYNLNATIRGSVYIEGMDVTTGTCGLDLDYEDNDGTETLTGTICDRDVSIEL
ncbi:MAG: hypothetical protein R3A45_02250 [Bdellovibrionota bacterium]